MRMSVSYYCPFSFGSSGCFLRSKSIIVSRRSVIAATSRITIPAPMPMAAILILDWIRPITIARAMTNAPNGPMLDFDTFVAIFVF